MLVGGGLSRVTGGVQELRILQVRSPEGSGHWSQGSSAGFQPKKVAVPIPAL